ncbi:LTA synthase family protein [Streptococcus ovuberis]|uniref:LTA synthase family protein n=1 Tax=Streptococcus ovuberis TaxID=1936207 RepID=A0A7X6S1W3_9STRE|nr:LTA synthase family protein [Streptococcus ovuberis]NKZ20765.1 LTA synthase family protein [Streptococcus ovuberis]
MKKLLTHLVRILQTRLGFVLALVFLVWFKTMTAYLLDFSLDTAGIYQNFLALVSPIATSLFFIGLALYIKPTKPFYITALILYGIIFAWLFANVTYYREFSDFITVNTILASSSVSAGLGEAFIKLFRFQDIIYFFDFILLAYLAIKKKIRMDHRPFNPRASFAVTALSTMVFSANLFLAEIDRPELLSRGFSSTYIVRSIGLNAFLAYSGNQTYKTSKDRAGASAEDIVPIQSYVSEHYAKPNSEYYGIAKGRNVIYVHLESFQQFLIDYHLEVDGQSHEVTPFLNSLYHSDTTLSFSNFFNQVKAGKTSDAETLLETGLFGLSQGSFMVTYGGTNTQDAAPRILNQTEGYTSAVFHGNSGSFWNRNQTYKQWGYDYFFDASYFSKQTEDNSFQYGLNDKIMLKDSIQYLERLQQPFYVKYITVSNHYPYTTSLVGDEVGFPLAQTEDETINGYFATANYLDSAVEAFFNYLKAAGVYDNSIIVLYGDHYGISNSRNPNLAPLIGKNPETWSAYDNAMLQRVPYMIVIPGMNKGKIIDTYSGQVDALPTLLHLLGIDASKYLQVGQDILSPDHNQVVALRTSGQFITPKYTSYSGRTYYSDTGEEITLPDESTTAELQVAREAANLQLQTSDAIQTGDLLRFYQGSGLQAIDLEKISYQNSLDQQIAIEQSLGDASTSIYSQNGKKTTLSLFEAPSYRALHPEPTDAEPKESSSDPSSSTNPSSTTEEQANVTTASP